MIDQERMAGVWSNYVRVSSSPYEFTLDFARLDFTTGAGVVVARVAVSPLLITQLIDVLNVNWQGYAERALPPEVQSAYHHESGGAAEPPPSTDERPDDHDDGSGAVR